MRVFLSFFNAKGTVAACSKGSIAAASTAVQKSAAASRQKGSIAAQAGATRLKQSIAALLAIILLLGTACGGNSNSGRSGNATPGDIAGIGATATAAVDSSVDPAATGDIAGSENPAATGAGATPIASLNATTDVTQPVATDAPTTTQPVATDASSPTQPVATATPAPTATATPVPTATPTADPTTAPTATEPVIYEDLYPVKYSEMTYKRPSLDRVVAAIDALEADVRANTKSRDKLTGELEEFFSTLYVDWNSMYALSYIKFTVDTTDPGWTAEVSFFDENNPTLEREFEKMLAACAQSPNKKYFEDKLFGKGTLDMYVDGPLLTEEIARLKRREAELVTQFQTYDYMSVSFTFGNWTGTIDILIDVLSQRGLYTQMDALLEAFYKKINEDTGNIFLELLKVRKQIAAAAGYSSYEQYVYERELFCDYTPEDAVTLTEGIRQKLLPLLYSFEESGNKKWNKMFDTLESFPAISYGEIMDIAASIFAKMDGSLTEVMDFMDEYELCYIGYGSEQAGMSFTSYIPKYLSPFIVIEGSGEVSDLFTFVHEFGHFYDNYFNYGGNNNLDMAEVSSTALSYIFSLYLANASDVPKAVRDAYAAYAKYSIIDTFVTQSMFHEFEHMVYQAPEEMLTLSGLNSMAQTVANMFGNDSSDFEFSWSLVTHFYVQPFYVISYVTSNAAALELYSAEVAEKGAGLAQYMGLVNTWYLEKGFVDNLRRVGLKSPFTEKGVDELVDSVRMMFE